MQNERHPSAEEQFTTITGLIAWDASNIHLCDSPEVEEEFTNLGLTYIRIQGRQVPSTLWRLGIDQRLKYLVQELR